MAERNEGGVEPRVTVVINGSAGTGDVAAARAAFERLRAAGLVSIRETDSAGVAPAVRTARLMGADEVVVVGGDGSVQRSAREVAGDGVVLVPAPGGTLNHFSRRYGIDTLDAAASLVRRGRVAEVPLGVADDLLFLNTMVLGAYPSVVRLRNRLEGVLGKWPAAGVGFAAALLRRRRLSVVIETETRRLERTTGMVWIGLGRGSWPLSHRIAQDFPDQVLEVVVLHDLGRLRTAVWLGRLAFGALGRADVGGDPAIERFRARSLLIRRPAEEGAGPSTIEATLDGDPVTFPAPLFVSAVDRALRIRVPE